MHPGSCCKACYESAASRGAADQRGAVGHLQPPACVWKKDGRGMKDDA